MLVRILEFFTMYEIARLQRLVCLEFRDAGQDRIHERGGRKLYEEGRGVGTPQTLIYVSPIVLIFSTKY